MRRNRLVFYIAFILSLILISFFGGSISYGILGLIIGIFCACVLHIIYQIFFYRIYQKLDSKNLICGKTMPFHLIIANESPLAFSSISINFFSDYSNIYGLDGQNEYQLNPHSRVELNTELLCQYRGEYEVGIKEVEVRDFLRLFSFKLKNRETVKAMIKPQIIVLDKLKCMDDNITSTKELLLGTAQPDILVREYINGDDYRMINWNASARMQKLMVKKTIGSEQQHISIIMDSMRYYTDPHSYLPLENKTLELAIALTHYFCTRNIPVIDYTYSNSCSTCYVSSLTRFNDYYEDMAKFHFSENATIELLSEAVLCSNELFSSHSVFIVTHNLEDSTLKLCGHLSSHSISVYVFLISSESTYLPSLANVSFYHLSSDSKLEEVLQ